jgi:hypothetical protein
MKFKWLVMVSLLVAVMLVAVSCKNDQAEEETVDEEPVDVPQEENEEERSGELVEADEAPTVKEKCGLETVIAFTGCDSVEGGNVDISFLNSGKGTINGAWYYIESGAYADAVDSRAETEGLPVGYEFLDLDLERGEVQTFEVDINKWENRLDSNIRRVTIMPAVEEDGEYKACLNQRKTATISRDCR